MLVDCFLDSIAGRHCNAGIDNLTAHARFSKVDVSRQVLVRVISEVEALGALTCRPLQPTAPDWIGDAPPQLAKGRARVGIFDEPLAPRRGRSTATMRADADRHKRLACEAIGF